MEDYVHRVGRTGRAGNKGTAYTFITPDQDRYAMDICKALRMSGQAIPPDLQALSDSFQSKVKEGKERASGSGFGGKGLERLDKDRDLVKKIQKKAYGNGEEDSDDEEIDLETSAAKINADESSSAAKSSEPSIAGQAASAAAAAAANAASAGKGADEQLSAAALAAKGAAAAVAARINKMSGLKTGGQTVGEDTEGRPVFTEEIIINDYPQKARWRVTNKVNKNILLIIELLIFFNRIKYHKLQKSPAQLLQPEVHSFLLASNLPAANVNCTCLLKVIQKWLLIKLRWKFDVS